MITDQDIEMVLFHPLFRQRVNEVLRRHGLLPEAGVELEKDEDAPLYPLKRGYTRAESPGLPAEADLSLEALGIYLTLSEACEKYDLTVAEIHEAVVGDRVRSRVEEQGVTVEQDTVEMWLKARNARLKSEERRKKPVPSKAVGLHIVSDRMRDPYVSGPAALRGNDSVGWPLPKLARPDGAVTVAEAGFMLGLGRMTCAPYISEGKLESAGPGWVTIKSVKKYGQRVDRKLKDLPDSPPPKQEGKLTKSSSPTEDQAPPIPTEPVDEFMERVDAATAWVEGSLTIQQASERYGYAVAAIEALIGLGRISEVSHGHIMPEEMERYIEKRKSNNTRATLPAA